MAQNAEQTNPPAASPADPPAGPEDDEFTDADRQSLKAVVTKERQAAREAEQRARAAEARAQEFEDRDKSEAQRLQEAHDRLKSENEALRVDNLRRDVAAEKGLTPSLTKRLSGTTREELEADADDLLASFPQDDTPTKPKTGPVGQGYRGDPPKGDPRDVFADFMQRRT